MAMVMVVTVFMQMVVGMGVIMLVGVRMVVGMGMGHTVMGVLVFVGMGMLMAVATNMIMIQMHKGSSFLFSYSIAKIRQNYNAFLISPMVYKEPKHKTTPSRPAFSRARATPWSKPSQAVATAPARCKWAAS